MGLRFVRGTADLVLRHRIAVLIVLVCTTLIALSQFPRIKIDNSIDSWFVTDDPDMVAYREMTSTYGSDDVIIVGIEAPDVFAPAVLERIDALTERVRTAPHVEEVYSLTSVEDIRGADGALEVGTLLDWPVEPEAIPALKARALANEMYRGSVVNADGTFAAILARLPYRQNETAYKAEAVKAIDALATEVFGHPLPLAGQPVLLTAYADMIVHDMPVLSALMGVALIGMLWMMFRSPLAVALPLICVGIAAVWALGWLLLAGKQLTVISQILPLMTLAIATADTVHLIEHYTRTYHRTGNKQEAVRAMYRDLTVPCFFTSLTTAIGMASLMTSRVRAVREFGLFAAIGVLGAFVLAMVLVPVVLSLAPPLRAGSERSRLSRFWTHVLTRAARVDHRYGPMVMVIAGVFLVAGLYAARTITTESGSLAFFREHQRFKQDTLAIENGLAGTATVEVVIDSGREDGVKDPALLHAIETIAERSSALPNVAAVHSTVPIFKNMRRAFYDDAPAEYRLPESQEETAQYLLLYEMDGDGSDIGDYVDYDRRKTRLSVRVNSDTSPMIQRCADGVRALLDTHLPTGATATITGSGALTPKLEDYIRRSLLSGFSTALLMTFVVLCFYLRSVPLGFIAMIPNIVPIVIAFGVMGALDIPLDTSTVTVASISIGLAVDDTIHFIAHVRRSLRAGHHLEHAFRWAVFDVGRAMIVTSAALCAAFTCLMLGEFRGMARFGLLCNVTILTALPADLFLLPAVVRVYARRFHPEWLEREDTHPWPGFHDVLQPAKDAVVEPAES